MRPNKKRRRQSIATTRALRGRLWEAQDTRPLGTPVRRGGPLAGVGYRRTDDCTVAAMYGGLRKASLCRIGRRLRCADLQPLDSVAISEEQRQPRLVR